jgi:hypothetical protein
LVEANCRAAPASRAERVASDRALALALFRQYQTPAERLRAWTQQTGRSPRAFYRRLDGQQ